MKKNKKKRVHLISISQSFALSFIIPSSIMLLTLIGIILFTASYLRTNDYNLITGAIIFASVMIVTYSVFSIIIYGNLKRVYQYGLYRVTASLLRNLRNNISSTDQFPKGRIIELDELNADLKEVNTILSNSTMISADLSSAYIPLNFISETDNIVTLASFKAELRSLIYCAQNFRNVILEVFYDLDDDVITEEESARIIKVLKQSFTDYQNVLFIPNSDNPDKLSGYYMFLPRINSFSHIEERLTSAMKDLSVAKKTFDGLSTINARFSIVCYPYSNIEEIFPDLSYAKRQGRLMNLYLPNRLQALSDVKIVQNSINLNNMSRVLEKLTDLKVSSRERERSNETIRKTLSSLIGYLGVDHAGVVMFDDVNTNYYSALSVTTLKENLFKEGAIVDEGFVDACNQVKDPDGSYYFSSRSHAGFVFARYLDKLNVSGGFFYIVMDQSRPIALVYFLNYLKDLIIDSYIRETLFILSYRIGDFITITHDEDKINETYHEINNVMMTSDYALYRIDRSTYDLVAFSNHFQTLFPKAKLGTKCYMALYGLESPCKECPLRTSRKMLSETKYGKFETSLTLNDGKSKLIRMLVRDRKENENRTDRFDKDLLINSFHSLKIDIANLYEVNSRGYVLVLRIDNNELLLKEAGSEGYLYLVRQLIAEIKKVRQSNKNIYYYSAESIAILLPEIGHIDVVNLAEKIYDVSKKTYQFNDINFTFNITYLPYSFPQSYPSPDDFLKATIRHFTSLNYVINQDKICFTDSDYVRSASRNEFMLSVIEEQFGNKTFTVGLQPMVRASDKSIYGAEILIRLSDNYRNTIFNAYELIKVAAQNGKMSLISNALLRYIGELYQQHGITLFKVYGFNRLTMNTDFSFFDDPQFFETLYQLFNDYHLPKDFLGFEINESEIYYHMDEMRKVVKGILNHHIVLIVDQYSGQYVSMAQLKELGFSEIKIGRQLVNDIEVNPKHRAEITSLDELAKENGMRITFVGVENADQYIIIRDLDKNSNCQGYHFYRPIDDIHLIEELRKNK